MRYNVYRVSTHQGGSLENIFVDERYDTERERQHRAWCKLLENERSPEYQMAMRLMKELGVDKTKSLFCAAIVFERVN